MRWQRYNFYFIKNTLKIKKIQANFTCFSKGVLLEGKRITFGRQKESFWTAKGVHLGGQKESFWKTTVFTSENDGNFMGLGGITAQATAGTP